MAIISITPYYVGQGNQVITRWKLVSTDTLANVTAAGYLNTSNLMGYTVSPTDIFDVIYSYTGSINQAGTGTYVELTPSISTANAQSIITLVQYISSGNIPLPTLPVVSGDFVMFSGTAGNVADTGISPSNAAKTKAVMATGAVTANHIATYTDTAGTVGQDAATAINAGNIQAGLSGTAGTLSSFPSTSARGALIVAGVANAGNTNTTLSNASMGQATIVSISDPGAATSVLTSTAITSYVGTTPLLLSFDITVGQAALAAGGAVTLIASSSTKRFKIRSLQLNSGGTNFSGGGGDRLGQVTDGTTVYSVVPAAQMQSLVNGQWGVTALPNPAAAAINTSTAAGAAITFKYSGGTTDYTAGSLVISGIVEQVVS